MTKEIGKKLLFSIDEKDIFQMRDGSFMKWIEVKQKKGTYLVRYVRPFRVQKIFNLTVHLN